QSASVSASTSPPANSTFGSYTLDPTIIASVARPIVPTTGINYSVTNFGAKGDGVTDDTAAIQTRINPVYNAAGGQVYFPPGTYIVHPTIHIMPNIILQGAGSSQSVIELANHAANFSYLFVAGDGQTPMPHDIAVYDLGFNGNSQNNPVSGTFAT